MKKHIKENAGTYIGLLGALTAIGTLIASNRDHSEQSRAKEEEGILKELSIAPDLVAGIDLSNQAYQVMNKGNGTAHITNVAFYINHECLMQKYTTGNDFIGRYYDDAKPALKRLFTSMTSPGKGDAFISIDMAQVPTQGQALKAGEKFVLFAVRSRQEIPTEELNRALSVMSTYFNYQISYCSDTGKTCDYVGKNLKEDCSSDQ